MIICADDYGLSPAVSAGIIELIEANRISAVSCMMIGSEVESAMQQLRLLKKRIDTGLHLVLTNDPPLTHPKLDSGLVNMQGDLLPFGKLMQNAYKNRIDHEALIKEISVQLKRFTALMGRPPDYIDGHQHIQQLPVIRDAIADVAQELVMKNPKTYVRVAKLPQTWLMTKGVFYLRKFVAGNVMLGFPGSSTARLMDRKSIPRNRYLLGFYDYLSVDFANIFEYYLTLKPTSKDIFFCHPGYIDEGLRKRDSVIDSRLEVLQFLKSSQSQEIMEQAGVGLNTFLVGIE